MKSATRKMCHGVLAVLAIAFAIKTFLYGGIMLSDPNESPLYESTLTRALNNFRSSEYVVGQNADRRDPLPGQTVKVGGVGQSQDHAGHNHPPVGQGNAGVVQPPQGQEQDHTGHNHPPLGQGNAGVVQAPQNAPDHGCNDMRAGLQFMQQGKFRDAVASFEVAAQCLATDACVQTQLGMAYEKLGEKAKSKQAYERAAVLNKAQSGAGVQGPYQPAAGQP